MSRPRLLHAATVDDTLAIGRAIGAVAAAGDLIALDGDLGAGKTQLVRGIAEGMGIDPRQVASPTFVISHEYEPDQPDRPLLVHVDAYRLAGPDDLDSIGWLGDGTEFRHNAVVVIEWARRVVARLGPDRLHVQITHSPDGRRFTLSPAGPWTGRPLPPEPAMPVTPDPPHCPICSRPLTDTTEQPFCSARCRQVDLGRWFNERYTVSRPIEQTDLEDRR